MMKGFTLIELLVVITIIGILATIVIVNLNSTRGRGQDAAIKEQMSQIRSIIAIYYSDNFGYTAGATGGIAPTACITAAGAANAAFASTAFNDADFVKSSAGILRNSSVVPQCQIAANTQKSQSWVMWAKLRVNTTDWWCVDSSGSSQQVTGTLSTPPASVTDAAGNISCN